MSAHDHANLPLPDYDHVPLPAVAHRVRSLTAAQLSELLDYEKAHANRPAAVGILNQRLAELAAGDTPSAGGQPTGPEWPEPASGASRVSPATTGPPAFPPPHGTPDQPARPKADRQSR